MFNQDKKFFIPLDVPKDKRKIYEKNYRLITKDSGRLFLFAGDQRVEHLNDDFFGDNISLDDAAPEHLFKIASQSEIGAFATQLELIMRYGVNPAYEKIPYIVKINSKTNLLKDQDPLSNAWYDVDQVVDEFQETDLTLAGIGYTVYLGSEFEAQMLTEAAQIVLSAHQHGLIAVLWMYPRGRNVRDEKDGHLIAGAVNVAGALGADFAKVSYPEATPSGDSAEILKEAVQAGGATKVICAGGEAQKPLEFLATLYNQLHLSGASGAAVGRNIHQKPLDEAVKFCNAISVMVYRDATAVEALKAWRL